MKKSFYHWQRIISPLDKSWQPAIDNKEYDLHTLSDECKAQLAFIQFVEQDLARLQEHATGLSQGRLLASLAEIFARYRRQRHHQAVLMSQRDVKAGLLLTGMVSVLGTRYFALLHLLDG